MTPDGKYLLQSTNGVSTTYSVDRRGRAEGDQNRLRSDRFPGAWRDLETNDRGRRWGVESGRERAVGRGGVARLWRAGRARYVGELHVAPASFTVLLGLNGAGKSTLFSVITHLYVSRSGVVRIFGRDVARESGAALAALGVVFQQRTLDPDLSVAQNLAYHGALHGLGRRETRAPGAIQLARVGLADRDGDKVRFLSGGQMRRVEIARALLRPAANAAARRADGGTRHQGAGRRSSRSCAVSSPTKGSASCGRPISSTRFATRIT